MASLRLFMFFSFLIIISLFNNWGGQQSNSVYHVPDFSADYISSSYEDDDINTFTWPAASKVLKNLVCKDNYIGNNIIIVLQSPIQQNVIIGRTIFIICGIKSFLHLLQLF